MLKLNSMLLLTVITSGFALTGCVSSAQTVANLQQTTPHKFTLPVNYIDAYINTNEYYQKCIARKGVSYPVITYVNGSRIRTTSKTPDTTISKELSRENKTANVDVFLGKHAQQLISFKENSENVTDVTMFIKSAKLRSEEFNNEQQGNQVELLKKVSVEKVFECIK